MSAVVRAAKPGRRVKDLCPCCGILYVVGSKHLAQPECLVREAGQLMRELGWARAGNRAGALRAMGFRVVEAPAYALNRGKDSHGRQRYRAERYASKAWWAPRRAVEAYDLFRYAKLGKLRPAAIRKALADPEWGRAVFTARRLGGAEAVTALVRGAKAELLAQG